MHLRCLVTRKRFLKINNLINSGKNTKMLHLKRKSTKMSSINTDNLRGEDNSRNKDGKNMNLKTTKTFQIK